ncbi:MAG: hypothetical protein HFG79_12720 [Lachnospiraceae bacterium]|nr:hypothetical protein [Lachnospiraceae bacterium]
MSKARQEPNPMEEPQTARKDHSELLKGIRQYYELLVKTKQRGKQSYKDMGGKMEYEYTFLRKAEAHTNIAEPPGDIQGKLH